MRFSKQQTNYQSEFTLFLNQLKKDNPGIEQQQWANRALLWDKTPINLDEQQRSNNSALPFNPNAPFDTTQ